MTKFVTSSGAAAWRSRLGSAEERPLDTASGNGNAARRVTPKECACTLSKLDVGDLARVAMSIDCG